MIWALIDVLNCYWGVAGTWIPVLVFCLEQVKCNHWRSVIWTSYIWSKSNTSKESALNTISLWEKRQQQLALLHTIILYMVSHSFLKFFITNGCNGGNFHWFGGSVVKMCIIYHCVLQAHMWTPWKCSGMTVLLFTGCSSFSPFQGKKLYTVVVGSP